MTSFAIYDLNGHELMSLEKVFKKPIVEKTAALVAAWPIDAREHFSVALFPIIVLAYGWLARSGKKRVIEEFGEEYRAYQPRVPMFFPRLG